MFLRPLISLSEFVAEKTKADNVEVYFRCSCSRKKTGGVNGEHNGMRAFSRVRWQREGQEWSFGIGSFLPSFPVVASLLQWISPEKAVIPILAEKFEKKVSFHPMDSPGANVSGWFRDILITTSGIRISAEGGFALFEDEKGRIWNRKPEWTGRLRDGSTLLLSPPVVLGLIQEGVFKGIVCKKKVTGFLHHGFDRIGGRKMSWCRTPDNLEILSGTIGLLIEAGSVPTAGRICQHASVNRDGLITFHFKGTKNCTLDTSMLKFVKQISGEYRVYQNGMMFQLPWVAVEGGVEWELP